MNAIKRIEALSENDRQTLKENLEKEKNNKL
ncbi:hypothetical protein XBFM1_1040002 [Xenorhabdus bovienii str. feltiae Moldova]|uniref:Uncharacterized protein n=1 Tax=Xenorhabdus bovienii str. feltiae Moldova TaxID=1398200 RepID=A0A077NPF1_XENBV|nr:hypothetical protein XBFM1_1040002 [Xenorhabdus bovienii str. feltiae Moldova]